MVPAAVGSRARRRCSLSRTEPQPAAAATAATARFTEVCNFADASWLTWLESERRGRSERRSLPALEELKRAYRHFLSLSLFLLFCLSSVILPAHLFLLSSFYLSFIHFFDTHSLSFTPLYFGTLEFRSYFDPRARASSHAAPSVFPRLSCFSRFIEEWRDAVQTLKPTEAQAKDAIGRKGMVDASRPLSFSLSLFLFLSPSLPCHVTGVRGTEIEDGGSEKEMDKRMVLILEPLALPSRLIPAPFHYRDEPQSFVRGFRPFSYFFYPLAILALSHHYHYFLFHDNWPLENSEFRSVPPEPFAKLILNLRYVIHGVHFPSFICDTFFAPLLGLFLKKQ